MLLGKLGQRLELLDGRGGLRANGKRRIECGYCLFVGLFAGVALAGHVRDILAHAIARGGTYVCMEGPQFSTYAESMTYKSAGYSVIGMTNMPEAKLAREAEIPYATVAMVTDFDCWHPDHDNVTVDAVVKIMTSNAAKARAWASNNISWAWLK